MISTSKYRYTDIVENDSIDPPTTIEIIHGNCFDIVNLIENGCLHNFANNEKQGGPCSVFTEDGNYISQSTKSNTQEDQLVKLYKEKLILPKYHYPIIQDNIEALLHSKCGDMKPVITLPAIICPNFSKKHIEASIIKRILLLLYVCKLYNYTLVTGLWGCGAFGADPNKMFELWKEALSMSRHQPVKIIFVIKIDSYSKKWNNNNDIVNIIKKHLKHFIL